MSRGRILSIALTVLVLGLGLGFAATPSCSRHDGADDGTPAVDTEIMAFLSEARALHHQANLAEEGDDLAVAIHAMDRLVTARRPHPERKTPEVEEVLADAYARLAELRLKKGDLDPAAAAVKNGLDHVADATYFRGHLIEVQGLVEEARAAQLADAGRLEEAKQAREHAIQLLEEVVKIQDEVIQRSLAKDGSSESKR
jgi:tetratricopeptide (TPR) repeat protein